MHRKLEVNEYCNLTELCWPHILQVATSEEAAQSVLILTWLRWLSRLCTWQISIVVVLNLVFVNFVDVKFWRKKKRFLLLFWGFFWFCLLKYFSFINITLSSIFCSAAVILQSLAWSLIKPLNTAQPLETNPFVLSIKEHLLMVFS